MKKRYMIPLILFLLVDIVGAIFLLESRGFFDKYDYIDIKNYKKKTTVEICDQIVDDIDALVQPMMTDDGYIPNDDSVLLENANNLTAMAEEMLKAELIQSYNYCESSYTVTFEMPDNSLLIYTPALKDTYSGGDDGFYVVTCDTCDWATEFSAGVNNFLAEVLAMWEDVEYHGHGADTAADYIAYHVSEYSKKEAVTSSSDIEDVAAFLESLGDAENRVTLWRGHGNAFVNNKTGKDDVALITGDAFWFGFEPAEHKADLDAGILARTTDGKHHKMAITSGFVEKYAAEADGGIFICGSCFGLANDSMAEAFLNKGLQAYIGANDSVDIFYSDAMLVNIAAYLTQKYENTETYISAGEALEAAISAGAPLKGVADFEIRERGETFRLIPSTSIKGTILADDGVKPGDILVKITSERMAKDLSVDENYQFELIGLDPEESYNLIVRIGTDEVFETNLMDLKKYKENDLGTIDVRTSEVKVHVVDAETGEGITGASVQITKPNGENYFVESSGDYYIARAYPGILNVSVTADGYSGGSGSIADFPNTSELTIKLEEQKANYTGIFRFTPADIMRGTEYELKVNSQDGNTISFSLAWYNLRAAFDIYDRTETLVDGSTSFTAGVYGGHGANGQESSFTLQFTDENHVVLTMNGSTINLTRVG